MIPKLVEPQRDFSGGQINVENSRGDDMPAVRTGARQAKNWRILNSRKLQNRPGRRALFVDAGRVEFFRIDGNHTYYLIFLNNGSVKLRDAAGVEIVTHGPHPWNAGTIHQIRWDILLNAIYITFPGMQPLVMTFDGANWSFANYNFKVTTGGQRRAPFYRFAPLGMTLQPSAFSGVANITFSANYLTTAMIGSRLRYQGRQLTILTRVDAQNGTATVNEPLLGGQHLEFTIPVNTIFNVNDKIRGDTSGAELVITGFPAADKVDGVLLTAPPSTSTTGAPSTTTRSGDLIGGFIRGELVIGPTATATLGVAAAAVTALAAPPATVVWDEEAINAFRGWPQSVFVDQSRLGFCDLPALPSGIAWSNLYDPTDFYVGGNPSDAMLELVPKKARVYNVGNVGSAAGDELVFTDVGTWYIPISPSNPLKPGSVSFLPISNEGASAIKPVLNPEGALFINSSGKRLIAIIGTGQTSRPYLTRDITEQHYNLLTGPKTIAVTNGEGSFPERYIYVLNNDGTVVVGRYEPTKDFVGFVPWDGAGKPAWLASFGGALILTNLYGIYPIIERLEDGIYLDAAVLINAIPPLLTPPGGGTGPLWWLPLSRTTLMDDVRVLGVFDVDAGGNIVPDPGHEGQDLSSPTLTAGQPWVADFEPFIPNQGEGQSVEQRMRRRRIARAVVSVQDSTGFTFSGIPPVAYFRRIPPNFPDDIAIDAPIYEHTYSFRPTGRSYDPRVVISKDVPGPLRILEFAANVTV